jgi:glucokinase
MNKTSDNKNTVILAGDIGGTKTVLSLFVQGEKRPRSKVSESYASGEAPGLVKIIEAFIGKHPAAISGACFGIAGPVKNGRCKTTNLPWDVSEDEIKKRFGWHDVWLLNDLTATAYAVQILNREEVLSLTPERTAEGKNIGIIAPGTGLGEAFLVFAEGSYVAMTSEGGHVDFAPRDEREFSLWKYLRRRYEHVSIERILSGPGLVNIYSWLKDAGRSVEPEWLTENLKEKDPAEAISEAALKHKEPLCVEALDTFVSILGATAGNLALTGTATGGIYLGGGIPPKILPKLKEEIFMKSFADKGRFRDYLAQIPVWVILNENAAAFGAARFALEIKKGLLNQDQKPRSE